MSGDLPHADWERGIVYFPCMEEDIECEDCPRNCPFSGPKDPYDCPDCDAKKSMHYWGDGMYVCEKCGYWE